MRQRHPCVAHRRRHLLVVMRGGVQCNEWEISGLDSNTQYYVFVLAGCFGSCLQVAAAAGACTRV